MSFDTTLFLRFADPSEAFAVLETIGILCPVGETGTLCLPCDGEALGTRYAIDLLFGSGMLHHATGETAAFEGEAITLTEPRTGFHINLFWDGPTPDELRPYLVHPQSPAVRFL
jgi:hypothetical protein